jgi:hypothetical protein
MDLSDLLAKRTEALKAASEDWIGGYFTHAFGTSALVLVAIVCTNPSWPSVAALAFVSTVWGASKYIAHLTLAKALLDENSSKMMVQVVEDLKKLDTRFTALSNRLGSHTGISLAQQERKPFNRMG